MRPSRKLLSCKIAPPSFASVLLGMSSFWRLPTRRNWLWFTAPRSPPRKRCWQRLPSQLPGKRCRRHRRHALSSRCRAHIPLVGVDSRHPHLLSVPLSYSTHERPQMPDRDTTVPIAAHDPDYTVTWLADGSAQVGTSESGFQTVQLLEYESKPAPQSAASPGRIQPFPGRSKGKRPQR